jgi:hypothetical protein
MKVYIGPYKNWFGPHQLAEKLCFWAKKDIVDEYGMRDYPEYVFKLGEFLAYGKWRGINDIPNDAKNLFINKDQPTWLYLFLERIETIKKRKVKIQIDKWDTWSMDYTLALITLPLLKQLKETKHGSTQVDLEDVPPEMRMTSTEDWDDQLVFDFYNDPELSKQNIQCDVHDRWNWVMDEMIFAFEFILDDDNRYSHKFDQVVEDRVANGLSLFGKYYRGLWD